MRWILCLLMMFAVSAALAPEAEARKARSYGKGYSYGDAYGYAGQPYRRGANTASRYYTSPGTGSMECIRARGVDPSGNYAGYPCWAQWALSPKRRF